MNDDWFRLLKDGIKTNFTSTEELLQRQFTDCPEGAGQIAPAPQIVPREDQIVPRGVKLSPGV